MSQTSHSKLLVFDFKKIKLLKGAATTSPEKSEENNSKEKISLKGGIKKTKRNINDKPTVYTELPDQSIRFHEDKLDISQI